MRLAKIKDSTNAFSRPVASSLLAAISITAISLWIALGSPVVYRPLQLIGPISLLSLQPEIGKYFYWSAIGFCALAGLSAIALARLPPTKAARRAAWACGVTSAWVTLDVLILPAIRIDAGLFKTGLASLYAATYILIITLAVVSWLRLFVVFPKERSPSEMANELGQLWNKIAISLPFGNASKIRRKGFFSWEFPFWRVALSNFTWVAIFAVLIWFLCWGAGSLSYWRFFGEASAVMSIAALVLWLVGYPVLVFGVLGQYMLGGKEERKSLLWFLVGVLVPVLVFALMLVLIVFGILVNLGILPTTLGRELGLLLVLLGFSIVLFPIMLGYGLVISLMIAVFYHGQIHPSAVIKKSTLYSVFGLIFTVLFVAIEGVIQSNLVVRLGEDSGQWSAILGGTFAALVLACIPFTHVD